MKPKLPWFLSIVGAFLVLTGAGFAQDKAKSEAVAWLANKTEPAAINVHGVWNSKDWGNIVLSQAADSREVAGLGDEWEIIGVVNGTKLYLVFYTSPPSSAQNRIGYSAILTPQGDDTLTGTYNSGLKDEPRGKSITLTRTVKQAGGMDPAKWTDYMPPVPQDKAFVYVYRYNNLVGRVLKPSIYVDDVEVASIENASYFIVKLAPGAHKFRSNDKDKTEVTVDAKPGEKYFVRVEIIGTLRGYGKVSLEPAERGDRDVHVLTPVNSSRIVDTKRVLVPGFDRTQ